MANFVATILMRDSFNRITRKKVETETDVLATAQTAVSGLLTDLNACIDLEVMGVSYVLKDATQVFAGEALSNSDVGATFRGRVASGEVATLKVPGFKLSLVGADGHIDVTDVTVAALLDNWEGAGEFTLSDGESIAEWLGGTLDK
jgi:hypothetical protein